MSEPSFARVSVGDVLFGKYRVERVLGVGGMGIVVAARHTALDALYAVKLMHPSELGNTQALARFAREARAAAKLRSEHVARVFDAGRTQRGIPYILLEYLEGCDLQQLGKKCSQLPVQEAVLYILHACDALVEAHAAGIIHRDLKPANLFLTHRPDGSPCVKVLDFGISKRVCEGRASSGMTRTTDIMGSPLYMSPEQMRSTRDVDARTDLWALGAILYKLLAGEAPFAARSLSDVYAGIREREPRPLSFHRPDVPPALEAAVRRCLRKNPDDRFGSALEVGAALAPFAPQDEAPRSVRKPSQPSCPEVAALVAAIVPTLPVPDEVPTARELRAASAPTLPSLPDPPPLSTREPTGAAWGTTHAVPEGARELGSRVFAAVLLVAAALGGGTGIWTSREDRVLAPRARPARAPSAESTPSAEATPPPKPVPETMAAAPGACPDEPRRKDAPARKKETKKRPTDPFGRSRK